MAVIAAAGCSSAFDPSPDPVGADNCVHIQDAAMEITQEGVDARERYEVTIEEWKRSPDSPFGAGEAGDLVERREEFVDWWDGYDCAGSAFDFVRWRADELTYPKSIGEYVVERIANED